MRTLTDHKLSGLNEALAIKVMDAPGQGGANMSDKFPKPSGDLIENKLLTALEDGSTVAALLSQQDLIFACQVAISPQAGTKR